MTEFAPAELSGWIRRRPARPPALAVALPVCLLTLAGVTVVLLAAPVGTRAVAMPVFLIGAGIMFSIGLSDLSRTYEPRFALALIIAGLVWSLSALSASGNSALYSVGRLSQWFAQLAIVYLLLSYPSGRLTDTTRRRLFAAGAGLLGLLYLPMALITQFPQPGLWSPCRAGCPGNAFALGHSARLVQDVVVPLREGLTVVLFAAVATVVTRRRRQAELHVGQLYSPIASVAVLEAAAVAFYFVIRAATPGAWALQPLSWIFLLALPGVALASAAGQLYRRVHTADTLDRIARSAGDQPHPPACAPRPGRRAPRPGAEHPSLVPRRVGVVGR